MADATYIQSSFLGGEWSKAFQGRIDRPDYRTAMNVCVNGIPVEQGSWKRRPGFLHAAHTRGGAAGRVLPYAFQQDAPYTIEMTDGWLRPYAGTSLASTNDTQAVLAISTANPAVVQTTTAHGWTTGNTVMFDTLGTNDPLLQNRQFIATVTDSTHFSLTDALTGANIDGSTLGTFVSGNVSRVQELVTPYIGGTWSRVQAVQADTNAILLHESFLPQVLSVTTFPSVTADGVFALNGANFKDGPYLDPVVGGAQVTPSAVSGIINLVLTFAAYSASTAYSKGDYVTSSSISYQSLIDQNFNNTPASSPAAWVVVSPANSVGDGGFVSTDIGRHVRLNSEPALWVAGTTYAAGNTVTYGANTYWTSLTASNTGNIPGVDAVHWAINTTAANWTWGKITSLLNVIPGNLASSVNIGGMTGGGGLSAAFDGNFAKAYAASAFTVVSSTTSGTTVTDYIGKDYHSTVAGAYAIQSGTIYPPTNAGIGHGFFNAPLTGPFQFNLTVNMRGSNTSPASASAGTLLGTYFATTTTVVDLGVAPITITSNDQTTTFKYVWFEITYFCQNFSGAPSIQIYVTACQVQFNTSAAGSSAGVAVEILGNPLVNTTAIRTWRLGLYNGTTGWPTCGTYHEGRLWLSGSVPNRIDGSQPNQPFATSISFSPTDGKGNVSDANAIAYVFNAPDVNSILAMKPDQQGIVCFTEKGEWLVQASALNSPLTPTSIQAHLVTRIGSSFQGGAALPVLTEHTTVFIQAHQEKLVEYFADVYSGKFSAPNIALPAEHLTSRKLMELAYQQSRSPVIWTRCADGSLLGCSYKRESLSSAQGPTFAAWHQHPLGSGRVVESICVGPSTDGTMDTLCVVTNDTISNVRHVEFLTSILPEGAALTEAWFLDNAVVPTSSASIVLGGISSLQLYGLWHLNGKTVTVFAGGLDCGDYLVTNGACAVPFGAANGLFSTAFVASFNGAMPIVVGFTYNSDGQLVRPALPVESGARTGPAIGKKRRTQYATALLVDTQGIAFGTDLTKVKPAKLVTPGETAIPITSLFTGTWRDNIEDDYSYDSMIAWRISRPYPATIAALGGFLQTQDA